MYARPRRVVEGPEHTPGILASLRQNVPVTRETWTLRGVLHGKPAFLCHAPRLFAQRGGAFAVVGGDRRWTGGPIQGLDRPLSDLMLPQDRF